MLPPLQKIAFLLFAGATLAIGVRGFHRVLLRIRSGKPDTEPRRNSLWKRSRYALRTTFTQSRTFRKRPVISLLHFFIVYGFFVYAFVNMVDAIEGFFAFDLVIPAAVVDGFNALADASTVLVLVGVIALVARRFLLPSRRDFRFNPRTWLHRKAASGKITLDSVIVSTFILFHVTSRIVGAAARLAEAGPDRFQPFATFLSAIIPPAAAGSIRIAAFWGSLGSILAFLGYFPYSKHIHIFMAPIKYWFRREASSGTLPHVNLDLESDSAMSVGANRLEDLAWPRLLDAYACIQCNRCQDVCPATVTGKSLSPSALEINKRMVLNELISVHHSSKAVERGGVSPHPLLQIALSPEALWACTTCGACMEVCPVQDEPMLDIIDIRRHQVIMNGQFPAQLQSAFRNMERSRNPWGIAPEQRLAWAEGLAVKTLEDNPEPDVLYWVGCAASYDAHSQKTARAVVELLNQGGVNFSVLGKQECCTGDAARRAGNEYLYQQLATTTIETLNRAAPKLIVASCPHCMNALGQEFKQLGGDYQVVHHTQYLETLVNSGKLAVSRSEATITYHDPCYLGRHNGVYDAPRNLLRVIGQDFVELERHRENAFCCGAGGAQFWKEEEQGYESIAVNRLREARRTLPAGDENAVLAVGCPFCRSMLESARSATSADMVIKDVAELLLEQTYERRAAIAKEGNRAAEPSSSEAIADMLIVQEIIRKASPAMKPITASEVPMTPVTRKKWQPAARLTSESEASQLESYSESPITLEDRIGAFSLAVVAQIPTANHPVTPPPEVVAPLPSRGSTRGGAFVISNGQPSDFFFPEDFNDEHRQIAKITSEFAANEVMTVSNQIEAKDFSVTRRLFQHAAELGLTAVDIPEEYGGLGLDKISSAIVVENMAIQGSFSVAFSGHVGIGTLPILWYGTPSQKAKYLPRLADGSMIGAYALSEAGSGSDALSARAKAVLSEDGASYILNGEKMWTTNAGFADLFTVFAKCRVTSGKDAGQEKLTAFLIEKNAPGLIIGKEEHKLGIRGSSTCPLILSNCVIPNDNLLGDVGKGHQIAFNILNVGRYKLGTSSLGAARVNLNRGIQYAKERHAFGKAIAEFGLIQEKLADGVVGVFVGEALIYRTVGLIEAALADVPKNYSKAIQEKIEEYAVECSIAKIWASEMHDRLIDEILQIYGGYGFVEDYPIERAYRDSRVNRIFEGTNEINRLIVTTRLLKSAKAGKLSLDPAIAAVMEEFRSASTNRDSAQQESRFLLAKARKLALFSIGIAIAKFGTDIANQQEVVSAIANIVIELYAMESALLRAEKTGNGRRSAGVAHSIAEVYAECAMERMQSSARKIVAETAEDSQWDSYWAFVQKVSERPLCNTVALRRQIAAHVLRYGKYPFYC